MSKCLPAIKPSRLIKVLERKGWYCDRTRGSHHIFKHPKRQGRIVVPVHGKDVKKGTLLSILDEAGISRDEIMTL